MPKKKVIYTIMIPYKLPFLSDNFRVSKMRMANLS